MLSEDRGEGEGLTCQPEGASLTRGLSAKGRWEPVDNFLESYSDSGLPVSSVHGILQARILEWVAMPSSRELSRPRDQT